MGGAESLLVGLNHIDDFAYVGGFSSAPLGQNDFGSVFPGITTQAAPAINARLRLFWIACGIEDGLLDRNQKLIAWLKEKVCNPPPSRVQACMCGWCGVTT
jgi:hypothetical protein